MKNCLILLTACFLASSLPAQPPPMKITKVDGESVFYYDRDSMQKFQIWLQEIDSLQQWSLILQEEIDSLQYAINAEKLLISALEMQTTNSAKLDSVEALYIQELEEIVNKEWPWWKHPTMRFIFGYAVCLLTMYVMPG